MSLQDNRLLKFNSGGNYRGFKLKGTAKESKNTGYIQTTLSDGNHNFLGQGNNNVEALTDAFNKIDNYVTEEQKEEMSV